MDLLCTTENDSWHSAEDMLQTLSNYTILSGVQKKSINNLSTKENSNSNRRPNLFQSNSSSVAGRGMLHENLSYKNFADRYASYNQQLRMVCGDGMSNELIEQHWGQLDLAQEDERQFDPVENVVKAEKCLSSCSDTSDSAQCSSLSMSSSLRSLDENISFNRNFSPVETIQPPPPKEEMRELDIDKLSFEDSNKVFLYPSTRHQIPRATPKPEESSEKLPQKSKIGHNALLQSLSVREEGGDPSLALKAPEDFLAKSSNGKEL